MTYLDRHYLNDEKLLDLIANQIEISNKRVLEIGIGDLRLTKFLFKKSPKKLIGCDLDISKIEIYKNFKKENDKFVYILENGLDIISKLEFDILFSNVPYSITQNLFIKILEKEVEFICLLIGKNFYEKVINNNFSILGKIINLKYEVFLVEEILGDKFIPKTKVKSVILKFVKRKEKNKNENSFYDILFSKTNRNTKNCLIFTFVDYYKISKKDAKLLFEKLNISKNLEKKKILFTNINPDLIENTKP